jgi:hypothetical protein
MSCTRWRPGQVRGVKRADVDHRAVSVIAQDWQDCPGAVNVGEGLYVNCPSKGAVGRIGKKGRASGDVLGPDADPPDRPDGTSDQRGDGTLHNGAG